MTNKQLHATIDGHADKPYFQGIFTESSVNAARDLREKLPSNLPKVFFFLIHRLEILKKMNLIL